MLVRILNWQNQCMLWRSVGSLSNVVGLLCYALSSSFERLFGEWNLAKIILYTTISVVSSSIVLFAEKRQVSKSFMLRAHVGFLVLIITSLYSFFYDKALNGKPDVLSIISWAAFALSSLCLSQLIELGLEVDLFNFFLGFLTVELMKISLIMAFVAAGVCYPLIVFRFYLDSRLETGGTSTEHQVTVPIDAANGLTINTRHCLSDGQFLGESNSGDNQQNIEENDIGYAQDMGNREIQSHPGQLVIGATSNEDHVAIAIDSANAVETTLENEGVSEETQGYPRESGPGDNQQIIEDKNLWSFSIPSVSDQSDEPTNQDNENVWMQSFSQGEERRGLYKIRRRTLKNLEVSEVPRDDGYAWRKYGQKEILGAQHPRSYFRCTHKYGLGCEATKQVQKIQEEPPLYHTFYYGLHTCKNSQP